MKMRNQERNQEIKRLHYEEGLSYREIGLIYNLSSVYIKNICTADKSTVLPKFNTEIYQLVQGDQYIYGCLSRNGITSKEKFLSVSDFSKIRGIGPKNASKIEQYKLQAIK